MALTKIGPSLGGSADIITVTQTSHGFVSNDRGKAVKMTNNSGTPRYMLATADSTTNADAVAIIIAVIDANTISLALSGRITVDACVPNEVAGTVLFLPTASTLGTAMGGSNSGHLTSTEPSGNNEVSLNSGPYLANVFAKNFSSEISAISQFGTAKIKIGEFT